MSEQDSRDRRNRARLLRALLSEPDGRMFFIQRRVKVDHAQDGAGMSGALLDRIGAGPL